MAKLRFIDVLKLQWLNANRSSVKPNRLPLCQECRGWGYISKHNLDESHYQDERDRFTTFRQFVTVEQLAQRARCGICASILAAYQTRAQGVPDVQSRPTAEISIGIEGPFYLDVGRPGFYSPEGCPPRLGDRSDPNHIVIRTFLRLTVKASLQPKIEHKSAVRSITSRRPRQASQTEVDASPAFIITPQFKLTYSNDDAKVLTGIQEWDVPFFDTRLLSGWLKRCEHHHAGKCGGKIAENVNLPVGFRVIDTHEEKVIEPDGFFSYAALSYIWTAGPDNNIQLEKSNTDLLAAPNSLRQVQLPCVITDAITLCRDLGERYLWIDRLCIVQDDEITKPGQINAMDLIYRSANFTIIGALDTRDDIGLPGCSGRPRHSRSSVLSPPYQPEVEGQGIVAGATADIAINTTLWNHRGWTFQERLLSRRCLYITQHQVIYKCCQEEAMEMLSWAVHPAPTYSERYDYHGHDRDLREDREESLEFLNNNGVNATQAFGDSAIFKRGKYEVKGTQFTIQDGIRLADYCDWVKDYSSRQLSYASDSFNAFSGVGNALRESFNCRMLFGIPEKYVAVCLLWDCPGPFSPCGEIHNVPSWSWVSSASAVTYECENESLGRDFLHIASLVYFHYQQPEGDLQKLDVEERWIQTEISIQELSEREELPPLRGKGIPGEWRTNQDWKECPQNPWTAYERQVLDPNACIAAALFPGALVFNTTVASLKINQFSAPTNDKVEPKVSDALLVNANDERVGTLRTMDCRWIETHCTRDGVQKLFEFAVISGRLQEYSTRKWSAWEKRYYDIWELNVMMVERLPCKSFVARRIGIGRVTMYRWKDCGPRWETVVLC
ncbi:heterokaryon incompatibility protein-domain-containing protein [Xylaria sp. FL1777]|nr:heterokaryon incompatibility protein-domain-containing protein [Xylaria sp. FL1777]